MLSKRALELCFILCILVAPLLACSISVGNLGSTSSTPTVTAGQSGQPLNVWQKVSSDIELRYEDWKSPGNNEDTVTILRFDLSKARLSIGYQPTNPMSVSDWARKENASVILNGGYFDQNDNATALVVSNGQAYGTSYSGFGGMLSVDRQGNIGLRSLSQQPYSTGEQLEQATQSSPMLMLDGKRTQFQADAASKQRSVVAQDTRGRLLFIVSPGQAFSIDELADLLVSSDLSIKNALNLDGGASTGLFINVGSKHVEIDSLSALPIVIAVK